MKRKSIDSAFLTVGGSSDVEMAVIAISDSSPVSDSSLITRTSQPAPPETPPQPIEVGIVKEFKVYILNAFQDQKAIIEEVWQKKFVLETHVIEYLQKLLLQMSLATKILNQDEPVTPQQCVKIVTLWKCARRPDVSSYFKKLARKARLKVEESVRLAEVKENVPIIPPLLPDDLPDISDAEEIETGHNELFENVACNVTGQPERAPALLDKEEKYETLTKLGDKHNFRRILNALNIPLYAHAFIGLSIVSSTSGFIHAATLAVVTGSLDIISTTFLYNPFEYDQYRTLEKLYKKRMPDSEVKMGWYGTSDDVSKLIGMQGFRRDLAPGPYGPGVHFKMNPNVAIEDMKEDKNGAYRVIATMIAVGEVYEAKEGDNKPVPKMKPGTTEPSGFFYESHAHTNILVPTSDHAALGLLSILVKPKRQGPVRMETTPAEPASVDTPPTLT